MTKGDYSEDLDEYTDEGREELIEDDVMTDEDEGFMEGYQDGDHLAKCPVCGKVITEDFVEKSIDGEVYRFCCDRHAEKYRKP